MVVLGIALTGLMPLTVMQSRVVASLEKRYSNSNGCYLVAAADSWVKKLGAAASLVRQDPGPPADPLLIVDDGDSGYSTAGDWTLESTTLAFRGDQRRHSAAPGSQDNAVWTFSSVPAGWYQVQATWTASPDQSSQASYMIYDGQNQVDIANAVQNNPPNGDLCEGKPWQALSTQFFRSGTARVQLGVDKNDSVVADGMRLVPVENEIQIVDPFVRSLGSEAVTVHVSVDIKAPRR
jgi:hypothetical protein